MFLYAQLPINMKSTEPVLAFESSEFSRFCPRKYTSPSGPGNKCISIKQSWDHSSSRLNKFYRLPSLICSYTQKTCVYISIQQDICKIPSAKELDDFESRSWKPNILNIMAILQYVVYWGHRRCTKECLTRIWSYCIQTTTQNQLRPAADGEGGDLVFFVK